MKKRLFTAVVPVLMLAGCAVGPNHLANSVHDWQNKNYEKDPLVTGVLTQVIPVYPICAFLGGFVDVVALNPVQFWGTDVWAGEGAAFTHEQPAKEHTPWFKK